jgi:hypothetical protein
MKLIITKINEKSSDSASTRHYIQYTYIVGKYQIYLYDL